MKKHEVAQQLFVFDDRKVGLCLYGRKKPAGRGSNPCSPTIYVINMERLKIEFLYYDKLLCSRCKTTDKNIKKTLLELKKALKDLDLKVEFKEIKLPKSKTRNSPSILINGRDVEKIVNKKAKHKNNICGDCCQLLGESANCRSFTYKGTIYDYIPKQMIKDAIKIIMS